jgi:cysteine desulfurase/selenocysteine lyase
VHPPLPLDSQRLRADFPILGAGPNTGRPLAYLDSAASAQTPRVVIDVLRDSYEGHYANVHRGVYAHAASATERFEGAREKVRRFLGARSPREIVFTRGTTEAINLVAWSWGRVNLGPGDLVVTTELEHHSNFVPWQQVAREYGADVRFVGVDEHGTLDLDDIERFAGEGNVKLVAVGHVSNTLGTVNPVAEIARRAHAIGAVVLVDGAQAAPHRAVDVQALDVDFYVFSCHKLPGPTGVGVLWGREQLLAAMPPWQYGGEMIRSVAVEGTTFNDLPWKFEAGTPAFVQAVGLGAAIDYLNEIGIEHVHAHERALTEYGHGRLLEVPGVTVHGPPVGQERGGILSFTMDCAHPHDIAELLDREDVNIRAGHHCTQPLMKRLGLGATARASVYLYNTHEDIDRLVEGLAHVRTVFA